METIKLRQSSVGSNPNQTTLTSTMADTPPPLSEGEPSLQYAALMSPPPIPQPRKARPLSLVSKKNNRLSISFPVQPSGTMSPGRQTPIQDSVFPSLISTDSMPLSSPQDSGSFMVALATQERKVFELREELSRAEGELKKLKSHWAIHEANKKRAEIRLVQRLETPQLADSAQAKITGLDNEEVARRSAELDRRKAILLGGVPKDSRRKIISGGHTRTLSLLSPDRSPRRQHLSLDSLENRKRDSFDAAHVLPRKMTMPDTSQGLSKISSDRARHSYQGSAAIGVKQIAEDLKAGLWTFMEDLRQATVGEEAMQRQSVGSDMNRAANGLGRSMINGGAKNVEQGRNRSPMARKSASKDRGTMETVPVPTMKRPDPQVKSDLPLTPPQKNNFPISTSTVDDDWTNWESPSSKGASPRWSNSTTFSSDDASEPQKPCNPANELNRSGAAEMSPPRDDESSWPAFNNFTPVNLKRTASAFIKEFEKSLTPPPESARNSQDSSSASSFSKSKTVADNEARLLLNNLP